MVDTARSTAILDTLEVKAHNPCHSAEQQSKTPDWTLGDDTVRQTATDRPQILKYSSLESRYTQQEALPNPKTLEIKGTQPVPQCCCAWLDHTSVPEATR